MIEPGQQLPATTPVTEDATAQAFPAPPGQPQPESLSNSRGSAPAVSIPRGLLIPAWVAAVSLAVIALVAVMWTVELVRIQLELQDAARSLRDYFSNLGNTLGGG